MAKKGGNPQNLKHFQPGQSGNPGGKVKLPEEVRKLAKMNREDFSRYVHEFLSMTSEEIKEAISAPKAVALQKIIGNLVDDAAHIKRDPQRLNKANWLMEQVFGKLKDQIEVTTDFRSLSDQELVSIGRQAILLLSGGQG